MLVVHSIIEVNASFSFCKLVVLPLGVLRLIASSSRTLEDALGKWRTLGVVDVTLTQVAPILLLIVANVWDSFSVDDLV